MRRAGRLLVVSVLLAGGLGVPALLAAGPARATACGTPLADGVPCTLTGTATVAAGPLNLTSPAALGWAATLDGMDQQLADITAAQQTYLVDDATGSGAGWHVTVSASTFSSASPVAALPDTATFSTNGSVTSESASSYPTAACTPGATCTLPAHVTAPTTYPVLVSTAAAAPPAYTIYDADAGSGMGSVTIGGAGAADPVGWWVNVPADALAATYTSTITLEVIAAP
jgi:WxL domain surface cell wall-binding